MDDYFACLGPPHPVPTAENQAKARLAAMIAAIRPRNPTQTLSGAFDGSAPLIDVGHAIFAPFTEAFSALLAF